MIRVGDRVVVDKLNTKHQGCYYPWHENYNETIGEAGKVVYINTPRTSIIVRFPNGKELCYDPDELIKNIFGSN